MEFEIYNENKKQEVKVEFKLVKFENEIRLQANRTADGEHSWSLLNISEKGIKLFCGVGEELGIELYKGKLKLVE